MIKVVDIADVTVDLEDKAFHVVDVREADEFAAGHVPGAINLPLSELANRYTELDFETPYHIICHLGGRSSQACLFLDAQGYDVTNINGGTAAWTGELEKCD
ncbi:rhodanese-like domain-containing protein [Streptococcus orisratti]|uniref:rhodanese-like domain-containing protein n=1 Tax=Streptococcus orisratti TaxID=114652 RepID=UPI000379FBE9|nr:rhodanese-like domain-containing protein [Streptococcus orisratti]MCI7678325.1 rhodanese-like domain-containing protein [Streptococcus orisratti]MDY4002139.1 rhodanese-like domain-containing protein [Streptococcus orisratti]